VYPRSSMNPRRSTSPRRSMNAGIPVKVDGGG
jgi:hypothetical protein